MIALLFVLLGLWLPTSDGPGRRDEQGRFIKKKRSAASAGVTNADPTPRKKRSYRIVHSPARGEQRALKNGSRARLPVGDVSRARKDFEGWLAEIAPLRDKDDNLPRPDEPYVHMTAQAMARLRFMYDDLEKRGGFTGSGQPRFRFLQEIRRSEKHVAQMFAQLGLTPTSRANLGLSLATAEAVKHIQPDRSPERQLAMARLLQGLGALPSPDNIIDSIESEVVPQPDEPEYAPEPESEPEPDRSPPWNVRRLK